MGKLARTRLNLVEEAHVFHRDHRLVGEGLDQLDLLGGERPHHPASKHQGADRNTFAHERYAEHGVDVRLLRPLGERMVRIGLGVVKLDGPAFERDPADERVLVYAEGQRVYAVLAEFAGEAVARGGIIETIADEPDGRLIGMAEPAR